MDMHYLRIFNTIAKYESYKKAAAVLYISQPALSIQIKKLEDQIGMKLFNKVGNKICLSENGMMLREYSRRIFELEDELDMAIIGAGKHIGGTLNLGGSNTPGIYIFPEIMGGFEKMYPDTRFNLSIGNTMEICDMVNKKEVDIAISGGILSYASDINLEVLFYDKLVLVASSSNAYCNKSDVTVNDLRKMNFIIHKTDSQLYTYYKKFIEDIQIPEKIDMYLGDIAAIKRAVVFNFGIALVPYITIQSELEFNQLKVLNCSALNVDYPYNLLYNRNRSLSATSQKFIEYIKSYINTEEEYKNFKRP